MNDDVINDKLAVLFFYKNGSNYTTLLITSSYILPPMAHDQ